MIHKSIKIIQYVLLEYHMMFQYMYTGKFRVNISLLKHSSFLYGEKIQNLLTFCNVHFIIVIFSHLVYNNTLACLILIYLQCNTYKSTSPRLFSPLLSPESIRHYSMLNLYEIIFKLYI